MKSILITGGAKRVGKDIALFFAKHNFNIILHYNKSDKEALATKQEIENLGVKCFLIKLDLSITGAGNNLLEEAYKLTDKIDIIINNAGLFYPDKNDKDNIKNRTKKAELMQINFYLPLRIMQHYTFKQKKGIIINMIDGNLESYGIEYLVYKLSKTKILEESKIAMEKLKPNFKIFGILPKQLLPPVIDGKIDNKKTYNYTGTQPLIDILEKIISNTMEENFVSC